METLRGLGKSLLCLMTVQFLIVTAEDNPFFRRGPKTRSQARSDGGVRDLLLQPYKQFTVFLKEGQNNLFLFLDSEKDNHSFSMTLVPCSASIKWSLSYRPRNDSKQEKIDLTAIVTNNNLNAVFIYEGNKSETVTLNDAQEGLYTLVVSAEKKNTTATIYISLDPGGPYELTLAQNSKLEVTPRRKNRLNVKWELRNVNFLITKYCLVVSVIKDYQTLCGAEEELGNFRPTKPPITPIINDVGFRKRKKGKNSRIQQVNNDTMIACVKNKTSLTLTKMKPGMKYYLNLFAVNSLTNMTIPYGSTSIIYSYTPKQITLRDGHRRIVSLKKHEGRIFFKFKAFKRTKELIFYVLVCGGSVKAEFERKGKKKKDKNLILVDGFRSFKFYNIDRGENFNLKIDSLDFDDELNRIKYIEVFATQNPRKYPFPMLPEESNVYEYESQKKCDSVTIGWIPAYGETTNKYCLSVRENYPFDYEDKFRENYQCNWDKLRYSSKYANGTQKNKLKYVVCQNINNTNRASVTTHKVDKLDRGKSYTIQITVSKKGGRTLSYKLLKVYTKQVCDDR